MRRLAVEVSGDRDGQRLDHILQAWLPEALGQPLSKSTVRRVIVAGAVAVNGRVQRRAGRPLAAGDHLEVRVVPERLAPREDLAFTLTRARVLYEDEGLIAVDKPPGLATVATADARRPHLVGAVERYLAAGRAERPYVGIHQRLDRETSGVVLFAKDPALNPALARAFAAREVEKTYEVLTHRPRRLPPAAWSIDEAVAGAPAVTAFVRRAVFAQALHVEARPRTGRKHQIRVHLASGGLPILGDERYGAGRHLGTVHVPRLMLHAAALRLPHPATGRPFAIVCPVPEDFGRVLAALARPAAR